MAREDYFSLGFDHACNFRRIALLEVEMGCSLHRRVAELSRCLQTDDELPKGYCSSL